MLQCRPWSVLTTWDLINISKMCWPSYFNLHAINLQIVSTQTVHHQPAHPCKPTNCRLPAWVRITTSKINCPSCFIFPTNKSPASASTVIGSWLQASLQSHEISTRNKNLEKHIKTSFLKLLDATTLSTLNCKHLEYRIHPWRPPDAKPHQPEFEQSNSKIAGGIIVGSPHNTSPNGGQCKPRNCEPVC